MIICPQMVQYSCITAVTQLLHSSKACIVAALQQLAVWDFRSYATIQTVWGETESYQFSIDYRYRTGT
jgi:hypothetical protein